MNKPHAYRSWGFLSVLYLPLLFMLLPFFPDSPAHSGPLPGAKGRVVVTEIRHWSNPDYTRIVISLTGKAEFLPRLLKQDPAINKPRRLLVDISGGVLGAALKKETPINDGLLKTARAGQFDKDTVRVVLDIESIDDYKVIPFEDPFRIVIDVTGKNGKPAVPVEAAPPAKTPRSAPAQQRPAKTFKIVIDAGHGGKDPGAVGRGGLREKDVTLKLCRMLKERLAQKAGVKTIMTRDADVFIPLEERTAIANREGADVFVSIHINSSLRRAAMGVETYILNKADTAEARRLAARENSTSEKAVGELEYILGDLIKTDLQNRSLPLAESVHSRLVSRLKAGYKGVRSSGIKGAPFYVLVRTRMPAILVEVSFVSNPEEERRLRTDRYLSAATEGISEGVINYLKAGPGPGM